MLDLNAYAFTPLNTIENHLVYAENGSSITLVIVDGEVVARDGRLTRVDEAAVLAEIRDLIQRAVLFFEPRVMLENVEIRIEDAENGRLDVILEYSIRGTNSRSNLVFPFYLQEGTHVDFTA